MEARKREVGFNLRMYRGQEEKHRLSASCSTIFKCECFHYDYYAKDKNTLTFLHVIYFFFRGSRGLNPGPCIYYALSKPTELSS
jgi:hypothetical protein